jgi:putative ABC transport system ATP-binding protein
MGGAMLAVKDLVAGYRGKPIARLENLSVANGEAAVLGGASGSGKTTLLLAIAGLADRQGGLICVEGQDVSSLPSRARDRHRGRHIGLIFQDLHLIPGLSALDNLLLAPFAAGAPRDRATARALLDRLGLGARAVARAETLSRGEAQRVAIARAMLMKPLLILADEPTASLDDAACGAVLDLLLEATAVSGAALVVATHDARVRGKIPHLVQAEAA